MGTRFIATQEANADQDYKQMLIDGAADDIVLSSLFTGVLGNYLKPSINKAGLDADNLPEADKSSMNFGSGGNTEAKAWKDIWGSGQGIGLIEDSPSVAELVDRLSAEYNDAKEEFLKKIRNLITFSENKEYGWNNFIFCWRCIWHSNCYFNE